MIILDLYVTCLLSVHVDKLVFSYSFVIGEYIFSSGLTLVKSSYPTSEIRNI